MCIDNKTPEGCWFKSDLRIMQVKYIQQLNGEQYEKYY